MKKFRCLVTVSFSLMALVCLLASGCSDGDSTHDRFPPSLVYYSPSQTDVVRITEEDEQRFSIRADGGDAIAYTVRMDIPQLGVIDTLVAATSEFVLRPVEFDLCWPHHEESVPLKLRLGLEDGDYALEHEWDVVVDMVPGAKFNVIPADSNLLLPAGLPQMFQMRVDNVEGERYYAYRLDNILVGTQSEYYFAADALGEYVLDGQVWWNDGQGGGGSRSMTWNIEVVPGSDQLPPDRITDLRSGPGETYGSLDIAFTPPLDNPDNDYVYRYEIRWFPYSDVEDWDSTYLADLIDATPGEVETRYAFFAGAIGDTVYVRVKSYDRAGNHSEWSNLTSTKSAGYPVRGFVYDAETGEGVPEVRVRYGDVVDYTDNDGEFYCADLQAYHENVALPPGGVTDEDLHPPEGETPTQEQRGDWFDIGDYRAIEDSMHVRLPMFKTDDFSMSVYANFTEYMYHVLRLRALVENDYYNEGHLIRPVYPIAVHVPEFVNNDIDYGQLIRDCLAYWEEQADANLFVEVAAEEAAALRFSLPLDGPIGVYVLEEYDPATLSPTLATITVRANAASPTALTGLRRVFIHELGHALGIRTHSNEVDHIMNSIPVVNELHPAEAYLMRCIFHIEPWDIIDIHVDD